MTKEEFLKEANFCRDPKFKEEDIHTEDPEKNCGAIVCTETGRLYLARFIVGNGWEQAIVHNTGLRYPSQTFYYVPIESKVIFWI